MISADSRFTSRFCPFSNYSTSAVFVDMGFSGKTLDSGMRLVKDSLSLFSPANTVASTPHAYN